MDDEILKIAEVAALYKTTPGAIRAALWRHRHHGVDPGIPLPKLVRGRSTWMRSAITAHLTALAAPEPIGVPDGAAPPAKPISTSGGVP